MLYIKTKERKYDCTVVLYNCDYCEKEIEIRKYKIIEKENGLRHSITCSKECMWDLKRKVTEEKKKAVCQHCNIEFITTKGSRPRMFCSDDCRHAHSRSKSHMTFICNYCEIEFEAPKKELGRRKYCSSECLKKDKNHEPVYNCDCCGKEFQTINSKIQQRLSGELKFHTCSFECATAIQIDRVELECEHCGKGFEIHTSRADERRYCSFDCYSQAREKKEKTCELCGELFVPHRDVQRLCSKGCNGKDKHLNYSVDSECANCGKDIEVTYSQYIRAEQNFCSQECKKDIGRAEFTCLYCDEKFVNTKHREWKFCSKKCSTSYAVNIRKFHISDRTRGDTVPQRGVNQILDSMGIDYVNEYPVEWYLVDNYLYDNDSVIEVMGDYWHINPIRFPFGSAIPERVLRNVTNDKTKKSYLKNKGINILYLWESDVNNNPELCEQLIRLYVNSGDSLENYHSFNYELVEGKIQIKEELIIPYQDMEISLYKKYAETHQKAS